MSQLPLPWYKYLIIGEPSAQSRFWHASVVFMCDTWGHHSDDEIIKNMRQSVQWLPLPNKEKQDFTFWVLLKFSFPVVSKKFESWVLVGTNYTIECAYLRCANKLTTHIIAGNKQTKWAFIELQIQSEPSHVPKPVDWRSILHLECNYIIHVESSRSSITQTHRQYHLSTYHHTKLFWRNGPHLLISLYSTFSMPLIL